jgi:hypothetical protein
MLNNYLISIGYIHIYIPKKQKQKKQKKWCG